MSTLNPWKYSYVRKLADEATFLAKTNNMRPILAKDAALNWRNSRRFNIPFLGDYVPEGWTHIKEIAFVDITGTAKSGERALTADEFYALITKQAINVGLGVIEMGQTQALVVAYRKE